MLPRSLTAVFCLFLLLPFTTNAQVRLGIEAGPNFSQLLNAVKGFDASGSAVTMNSQAITQFFGGVFADIPLGKKQLASFRPALQYFGAGGEIQQRLDYNGNLLVPETKITLNYIQLPLQLLLTPPMPFGKLWVGGGFYEGVLLSGKSATQSGSESLVIGNKQNDQVKRFDLGFTLTAGVILKPGVVLGADYRRSLGTIDPPLSGTDLKLGTRNSVWSIHLAYEWKLKH